MPARTVGRLRFVVGSLRWPIIVMLIVMLIVNFSNGGHKT